MSLGIHWAVDVAARILLAIWSVYVAERLVSRSESDAGSLRGSDETEDGIASDADFSDRSTDDGFRFCRLELAVGHHLRSTEVWGGDERTEEWRRATA